MPVHKCSLTEESNADEGVSGRRRCHHLRHHGKQPVVDREESSEEDEEEEEEKEEKERVKLEEEDHRKKDIKGEEGVKGERDGEDDTDGEAEGEDEGQDSEDSQSSSEKSEECIDKSMRLGNNECPACRKHCASRRSLRDDPNFDSLIAALYPDIDKYEEEELACHEEEKTRNKEIQASIAQIFQRQIEALSKRRTVAKDTAAGAVSRPHHNLRTNSRRKRSSCAAELNAYEDKEEDGNNCGKDSSSADEQSTEVRQRKKRKRTGARALMPSTSADAGCIKNGNEAPRENRGISPGLVWNPEMLAWGRGGTRSNTRHGGANGGSKNSRNTRLSRLTEHLRSLEEIDEVDIHCMLVSLDKISTPDLKLPYFSSRSSLLVGHLREYVALQTALQASEIEMLILKNMSKPNLTQLNFKNEGLSSSLDVNISEELQLVEEKETLASIRAKYSFTDDHLILAYRQKKNLAIS